MRKKINIFVSYARANRNLAVKFLEKFHEQAMASRNYQYSFWRDNQILVGEKWHDEIKAALEQCDLGLLLISPAFLGSQYIGEHELPGFMGNKPRPMLQPVDPEYQDLKGLQMSQIFKLDRPGLRSSKSFGQCTGPQRDEFAQELFKQVEARLGKLVSKRDL